jgi:hypothetical protein
MVQTCCGDVAKAEFYPWIEKSKRVDLIEHLIDIKKIRQQNERK